MSYADQKSTWNSGVRKAIRRGLAEEEVRKHQDRVTGARKQISKQRRRVHVSYDPSMVEEKRKRRGNQQLFYGTWVADLMLRQDAGSVMLGKDLSDKKSHGSEGDDLAWRWQEIRQQPVF